MERRSVPLVALALLVACAGPFSGPASGAASAATMDPAYTIVDLGTIDGDHSVAYGINDAGQIVGATTVALHGQRGGGDPALPCGEGLDWRAFVWANGEMVLLDTSEDVRSEAYDINAAGQVIGMGSGGAVLWDAGKVISLAAVGLKYAAAINDAGWVVGEAEYGCTPESHAALWNGEALLDLGTLGGDSSRARDINNAGQVVGTALLPDADVLGESTAHAFLWEAGAMIDLGTLGGDGSSAVAINEASQVAGTSSLADDAGTRAVLWDGGRPIDLGTLGGDWIAPTDINDGGVVVGYAQTAAGQEHAFVWDGERMVDLGTLGGGRSRAHSINGAGQIVGEAETEDGETHAVLWVPAR